ncbi:MAG TPA: hypothetical protein VHE59_03410 [Mucilaginibacter sp.]|nr:hypothetical protein [Mucilaginibacter sp.]
MKKLFLLIFAVMVYYAGTANAQIYNTSAGLSVEMGTGSTLVGPAINHFFDQHSSAQAELLFGGGDTFISAFYHYNDAVQNAKGLDWFVGAGPALGFGNGSTSFYLRPAAGLDYKIDTTPLDLSFDWRPTFYVGSGSSFTAARFGLGLRFCF